MRVVRPYLTTFLLASATANVGFHDTSKAYKYGKKLLISHKYQKGYLKGLECNDPCTDMLCNDPRGTANAGIFLQYGGDAMEGFGGQCDDCSHGPFDMTVDGGVPFFGSRHANLYINSNGLISFGAPLITYTSQSFPISGQVVLAPFWTDMDFSILASTEGENMWSYSNVEVGSERAAHINQMVVDGGYNEGSYTGVAHFVVTYHKSYFYAQVVHDRTSTVQAIVTYDAGGNSYAIFNYGDLEWVTGPASGGDPCTGLGGVAAQVGFNDGEGNFFQLPFSQSDSMMDVELGSNVGLRGRYIYRINEGVITGNDVVEEEDNFLNVADGGGLFGGGFVLPCDPQIHEYLRDEFIRTPCTSESDLGSICRIRCPSGSDFMLNGTQQLHMDVQCADNRQWGMLPYRVMPISAVFFDAQLNDPPVGTGIPEFTCDREPCFAASAYNRNGFVLQGPRTNNKYAVVDRIGEFDEWGYILVQKKKFPKWFVPGYGWTFVVYFKNPLTSGYFTVLNAVNVYAAPSGKHISFSSSEMTRDFRSMFEYRTIKYKKLAIGFFGLDTKVEVERIEVYNREFSNTGCLDTVEEDTFGMYDGSAWDDAFPIPMEQNGIKPVCMHTYPEGSAPVL